MKKVISCILILLSILVFSSCSSTATETSEEPSTTPSPAPSEEPNEYEGIDNFITRYNETASYPITEPSEMDIHGVDYRTEFRLNAFKNAVGKMASNDFMSIEIVNYGVYSNNSLRVYLYTDTFDDAKTVCTDIIHVMDSEVTDEDIENAFSTNSSSNIALGNSNNITGYINAIYADGKISSYEAMIDTNKLN